METHGHHSPFIGDGRGRVVVREAYAYVGDSDPELFRSPPSFWRSSWFCCGAIAMLTLAVVAALLVALLAVQRNPSMNCSDHAHDWQHAWSLQKMEQCCSKTGVGCLNFYCVPGYGNSEEAWTPLKKRWCCQMQGQGLGCSPPNPPVWSCEDGAENHQEAWGEMKRSWCCQAYPASCEMPDHQSIADLPLEDQQLSSSPTPFPTPSLSPTASPPSSSPTPSPTPTQSSSPTPPPPTTTTTATTSNTPVPTTRSPTTPVPTTTVKTEPCKNSCSYSGVSAHCDERIQYAVKHNFGTAPNACILAHKLVLHQCDSCSQCTLEKSNCQQPQKPEVGSLAGVATSPAPQNTPAPKAPPAAPPGFGVIPDEYDCMKDLEDWTTSWSIDKKVWCCHNQGTKCPM
eukprot:TRINITY_DN62454_c0_g1_i1.p1 TRINITY_DN62454_c0_g1~~TRINITY_DN62454_c0_g1_i1.p1  ORF type:complete len:411 (+),score=57.62 TRINITY_DN62454_c0_g1_i1:41-1234(+)